MSRSLDAEVAVKVFGHRIVMSALKGRGEPDSLDYAKINNSFGKDLPPYSTDISAAFKVVAKMRERGWTFRLNQWADGTWTALFFRLGEKGSFDNDSEGTAPGAAEAIVRAALAAIEKGKGR